MFTRGSPLSQEAQSAQQRENVGVQHPTFFTFTPRKHPADPPEHFDFRRRSVARGAQTERGAADALARLFCDHRRHGRGLGPKVPRVSVGSKLVLHCSFAAIKLFRPDSHSDGALDCQGPV
eukprot:1457852-Prymnesium_polylepis.1